MPAIDKPISELKEYTGTNPCPADFDEYWDRGVAEMKTLDPEVKLEAAEFQVPFAECFDLTFTGVGGSRVYAKYLRPKSEGAHPAVVNFHGYSGHSGEWSEKLPYVAAGYSIASMDCRGQGGRSEDLSVVRGTTHRGHIIRGLDGEAEDLYFRKVFLDAAQLAGIVMSFDEVDEDKVASFGGSQGGALSVACAALEPRINRCAPMFPFLSDYKRVWEMDLGDRAYEELRDYFRRHDPLHKREDEVFERLGYVDVQHLAPRVQAKTLMAISLIDTICPPSTQFAVYNKLNAEKEHHIYKDFGHENLPGFIDSTFQFLIGM